MWEQGPPYAAASRGTQTFRQQDPSQAAQRAFIKLAPGISGQDVAVKSTLPLVLQRRWHGGCQTRPTAMAKNGLVIYVLVIILLLDQTSCHASKFKARKHSKRRVKGNRVPPSSRTLGLLRVGRSWTTSISRLPQETISGGSYHGSMRIWHFQGTEWPLNSLGLFDI